MFFLGTTGTVVRLIPWHSTDRRIHLRPESEGGLFPKRALPIKTMLMILLNLRPNNAWLARTQQCHKRKAACLACAQTKQKKTESMKLSELLVFPALVSAKRMIKFQNSPRVRRKWQTLSLEMRTTVADALWTMKTTSTIEGRKKYGRYFMNLDDITTVHACAVKYPTCDQGHYGPQVR